jgi:subtilase family serine protease
MPHIKRFGLPLAILLAAGGSAIFAQAPAFQSANEGGPTSIPASRLAGDWQASSPLILPAAAPQMPQPAVDLGVVPDPTSVERVLLLLEPSAAQRQALDNELENQQLSGSPEYHRWLTPSAFAARFANSARDIAAVVDWLTSQGLHVAALPTGRGWVEFSGTATQIEQAFHTQLHSVLTTSGTRIVIAAPIAVPAALRPLVHGLVSLDGSISAAALTPPRPVVASAESLAAETSIARAEALPPQIAAQLLHLDALHSSGPKGDGETIAIAGRSNVKTADIAAFRSTFGLTAKPLSVVLDGADPGLTDDQAEAVLTASWAGAAAPDAQIILVPAASTDATDGVDLSLAAIVNQSLAHTVLVGYASCEAALSESHQAFYSALYRQAAAQGMSVIAATGDSGPAACQVAGSTAAITTGYNVDALASTPWNTAVGAVAVDPSNASGGAPSLAAWSPQNPADPAYAGGGGRSLLYRSPTWQPLPSQPSPAAGSASRLIPDLALPTAADTGANRGLAYCLSAATSSNGCNLVRSGGSSAAAAIFAGVSALIAEKNGLQGNLAPNLYALSRQLGVFDDVEQGSTNLACAVGSPGCDASGRIGYATSAGYDLATGLGSINAQKLVNLWATPQAVGTGVASVDLTFAPTVANDTYNPTAQITFTATVISGTGGAIPTGTVFFFDRATNTNLNASAVALANGIATVSVSSVFALGGNNITAVYSGDATYASVTSAPVNINIQPSSTSLIVTPSTITPAAGALITVSTTLTVVTPPIGTVPPTGKVTLNLDGKPTASAALATDSTGATTATFPSISIPSAGVHTLQTIYVGDANYKGSTSPAVSITATKGATVTALVATPATLTAGVPETLTVTIAPANAAAGTTYSLTGTVSFYDGTTLLGTAVVNANAASLPSVTLAGGSLHNITAIYSGDTSWAASTSNALALQSVLLPDSITLAVNINTTGPGQVVSLVATVTPAAIPASNAEQNPTGNVVFYNGTTILATVVLVPSLNFTSTATLITGALPGGQNILTAVYIGDLFYMPATSNPVTIDVQDFSITPSSTNSPTNLKIIKGSSGSASYVVTGLGGFNGQVQVVCAVPTQDDMTCTPSPQQVSDTGTVTFTVQTFASGGTAAANHTPAPLWPRLTGGTALAGLLFFLLPMGRRARIFIGNRSEKFLLLALLLADIGIAGMGCSGSVKAISNSGTPLGVATLTITAAAYVDNTVVSHSVYLTVNVLPPGASLNAQQNPNSK